MKNSSQRYNIDRPRPRHEHKCRKYNMCLSNDGYMNKQYLSNIWSSIHKKVEKHWGWVKKNLAYKKKYVSYKTNSNVNTSFHHSKNECPHVCPYYLFTYP